MAITDWPADERPREKLLQRGADALSDAELLAIFLRTGVAGRTAVDLARDLLTEFGSLRSLLMADQKGFCAAKGLGEAKYVHLQAVLEIARRYLWEDLRRGEPLQSPGESAGYICSRLRDRKQEVFACLFLDSRHRVVCFEELFHGSIDRAVIYPREVAKRSLQHNAAAVILAHNHPSGVAEPSEADRFMTEKLVESLALIDVRVLDHLIVGDSAPVSMAERGLL